MTSSKLMERTLDLARNRPRILTYEKIGEAIDENPRWIKAFCAGIISEPSVVKVEKLYVYLAGKELEF